MPCGDGGGGGPMPGTFKEQQRHCGLDGVSCGGQDKVGHRTR